MSLIRFLLCALLLPAAVNAQTLTVVHQRAFRPDTRGTLTFTDDAIVFDANGRSDRRQWQYIDIQHVDRLSERAFVLLTYEDEARYLGRDRRYRFRITSGRLDDDLFARIRQRLGRPVTDRVVPDEADVVYAVPVKHLHATGGCEGELRFTSDGAVHYRTAHAEDARAWRLDTDLHSIWSADPFRLDVQAYEGNRRAFSRSRTFRFSLKAALDRAFYRRLVLRMYARDERRTAEP